MSEPEQGSTKPSRAGCFVASALLLVPGVLLAASQAADEWPFALFYGALLAAPFAYLGLDGTRDWLPWVVAVVLTCLFWGALVISVIISAREQSGVNFGMGVVMLASPFITTFGTWAANRQSS